MPSKKEIVEGLREASEPASDDLLCAEDIVKELADWSRKYPKGTIYPVNRKNTMDAELEKIEQDAKHFMYGI